MRCERCGALEKYDQCSATCPNARESQPVTVGSLEELADLQTRRFEFLLGVMESGEWSRLRKLAREKGLL